ncbi:MAG TPA: Rne/Rng family ribonuclease, partial [Marmoricola sp.]|nr:Rne/Rng family ribonuclease [Marmoricola sp.]
MTESDNTPDPTTTEATGTEATGQPGDAGPAPDAGSPTGGDTAPAKKATTRKTAAKKTPAKKAATRKTAAKKTAARAEQPAEPDPGAGQDQPEAEGAVAQKPAQKPARKTTSRRTTKKAAATESDAPGSTPESAAESAAESGAPMVLFQAPEPTKATARKRTRKVAPPEQSGAAEAGTAEVSTEPGQPEAAEGAAGKGPAKTARKPQKKASKPGQKKGPDTDAGTESADRAEQDGDVGEKQSAGTTEGEGSDRRDQDDTAGDSEGGRRRRRRGGRRRRKGGGEDNGDSGSDASGGDNGADDDGDAGDGDEGGSRRRRTRNRQPKSPEDEITSVSGSTRLEAKKQRRREGREAGRRRAPIVSEAEFLARREAVDRVMVIRQKDDLTQIGVLEDKVLVEHYVARESQTSIIGNIYLGRVQNVLPSMEAAFVDIGKGRNAVLYAGEVNWKALGHKDGQQRKIESVLSSGQTVLVQVTKDPIGHKGARLTGQISLPGRFLVYVPDGTTSGISRKLPDTERSRLKTLLKEIVPDSAGVIVRTAAEGASEDELTRDVERLTARWSDIEKRVEAGKSPELLYGEPDLTLKVVRDLFTEDFARLVVQGDDAWDLVDGYVSHVAPDLRERLERFEVAEEGPQAGKDVFASHRVDEQIAKGLDRKVWLPSGGSLIIDRTEAMTVVDVNTGKFTGSGGNLEETVTKNNLEAAEEIVRQLRLRDIGGIIVVDFIDMVLESNRDLVLRRMVECLGRDRTRHQVAEVTSLGLVQMTRKRIGTGLLEAFSESCEHCGGRGLVVHHEPVEPRKKQDDEPRRGRRGGKGRDSDTSGDGNGSTPTPKDVAAMAKPDRKPSDRQADQASDRQADQASDRHADQASGRRVDQQTGPDSGGQAGQRSDAAGTDERQDGGRARTTTSSRRRGAKKAQPTLLDDADEGASDMDAGEPTVADKPVADEAADVRGGPAPTSPATGPATGSATSPEAAAKRPARKRAARRAQGPAGEPAVVSADEISGAAAREPAQAPVTQPGVTQPGVTQPGVTQPGVTQP